MNLNRILLIGSLFMGVAALAISIDGRARAMAGKTSAAGHGSDCSCSDPSKPKGSCGAGCCGGGASKGSTCGIPMKPEVKAK